MSRRQSVPVVLTRDEQIAKAVHDRWTSRFVDSPISMPTWTFEIGEVVQIGNLHNVRVIGKFYDDRVIVVQHTDLPNRDRKTEEERIGAWWWFDVFPLNPANKGEKLTKRNLWRNYINTQLDTVVNDALCNEFRDNPVYQRDYVWTLTDKLKLIDSVFNGREIGKFVFVRYDYPDNYTEVLDGKQRINALFEFCTSKFAYKGVYWHQLDKMDRYEMESVQIQSVYLEGSRYTKAKLLEIFLEVNASGVPQTEEHLNKVRAMLDAERAKA